MTFETSVKRKKTNSKEEKIKMKEKDTQKKEREKGERRKNKLAQSACWDLEPPTYARAKILFHFYLLLTVFFYPCVSFIPSLSFLFIIFYSQLCAKSFSLNLHIRTYRKKKSEIN